jgi:hypothetical protein
MVVLFRKNEAKIFKNKKIIKIIKLIYKFRQSIKLKEKTPLVKLCLKILNQKLQKIGVLDLNQCLITRYISENDVLKRRLTNILKNKLRTKNNAEIIKLIKNKKIFLKNRVLDLPNVFLGLESERIVEIKI